MDTLAKNEIHVHVYILHFRKDYTKSVGTFLLKSQKALGVGIILIHVYTTLEKYCQRHFQNKALEWRWFLMLSRQGESAIPHDGSKQIFTFLLHLSILAPMAFLLCSQRFLIWYHTATIEKRPEMYDHAY